MARVVIIGAGITGISTAYHLERLGFFDYVLLEQEQEAGGLCRSFSQEGFTFDYTGHLLHLNNQHARDTIFAAYSEDQFAQLNRRSAIFSQNVYTKYPFQINLHGLPPSTIVECIKAFIERPQSATAPTSFREWVLHNFGAGLGKYFFFPYQQKIFDINIDELSASWTGRFVPATSLHEMLQGAFGISEEVGYNAQFLYPRTGGIMRWVTALHNSLHNSAKTEHSVTKIDGVQRIVYCANGHEEPFDILISTMPLDRALHCLVERPDTHLAAATAHLRCNSVINFNLGIRRPFVHNAHWVYYPETQYPFYRIGFPSNLTPAMAPIDHSSLAGECSFLNRSEEEINERRTAALSHARQLFSLRPEEITTEAVITIPHAYVIFDQWRDQHLPLLLTQLATEYRIHSVGRYGAWKYSSMQDALLEGRDVAQSVIGTLWNQQ